MKIFFTEKQLDEYVSERHRKQIEKLIESSDELSYLGSLHDTGILTRILNRMKFKKVSMSHGETSDKEGWQLAGYLYALDELAGMLGAAKRKINSMRPSKK
jgi:hypothetical protein